MGKTTQADVDRVIQYRNAAVSDGWEMNPTYPGSGGEDVSRAASLTRDGFVMQVITRIPIDGDRLRDIYEAGIAIWGPDGLAINVPSVYDFEEMKANLRTCSACKRADVDTQRVGFAGRCCAECLSAQREIHEYPGWTN